MTFRKGTPARRIFSWWSGATAGSAGVFVSPKLFSQELVLPLQLFDTSGPRPQSLELVFEVPIVLFKSRNRGRLCPEIFELNSDRTSVFHLGPNIYLA